MYRKKWKQTPVRLHGSKSSYSIVLQVLSNSRQLKYKRIEFENFCPFWSLNSTEKLIKMINNQYLIHNQKSLLKARYKNIK